MMWWPHENPEKRARFERAKAEIDAAYKSCAEQLSRSLFTYRYEPYVPPKRWSHEWWRFTWNNVRGQLSAARRRVGMWIGGIHPSELEGGDW